MTLIRQFRNSGLKEPFFHRTLSVFFLMATCFGITLQDSVQEGIAQAQTPYQIARLQEVPSNDTATAKAARDEFLTQPPRTLPAMSPPSGVPSAGSQGSVPLMVDSSSMNSSTFHQEPVVNYGGGIAGIQLGPNDVLISDAIVEIPKGEGYEALISANGQGLLVELGLLVLDAQGNSTLNPDGSNTRTPLKRGTPIRKGMYLGKQNDREHAANKLITEQQLIVANKEAEKQLEIEVAELAVRVAQSEYQRAQAANEKMQGAIAQEEVVQRGYEWMRAQKSAEKSHYDLGIKADEVEVRKAQVIAAEAQVVDRQLISPIDGFVDEIMQNEGQWLREGDHILKIIRLDKVMVCGKIDANHFSPEMVDAKPVTIYVKKPGQPVHHVKGTIVYARQMVESGAFSIYAEADNVANEKGYWLLNPGTIVSMVVHR